MSKFKVGDRVCRRVDVYDPGSKMMRGTVTKVYDIKSRIGYYPEVYEVVWDGGPGMNGFLPHGLDPLPVTQDPAWRADTEVCI